MQSKYAFLVFCLYQSGFINSFAPLLPQLPVSSHHPHRYRHDRIRINPSCNLYQHHMKCLNASLLNHFKTSLVHHKHGTVSSSTSSSRYTDNHRMSHYNIHSALYATSSDELQKAESTKNNTPTTTVTNMIKPSRKKKSRLGRNSSSALHATSSEELKSENVKRKRRRKRNTSTATSNNSNESTNTTKKMSGSSTTKKRRILDITNQDSHQNDIDLQEQEPPAETITLPSFKRMESLSRAIAKESAEREALNDSIHDSSNNNSSNNEEQTAATKQPFGYKRYKPFNVDDYETVSSLTQLTQVIDSQLYANGPRGTGGDFPILNGVISSARDNMISLLGFNEVKGDWKKHYSKSTYNVAIVFGKDLVRDQITVEYASRIRVLARIFKEDPEFRPSLVCFCGGIADGNHVSNADAGYIFFRHMCEAQNIDLDGVGIFIDNASLDDEDTIYCVTEKVKNDYVSKWLEASPTTNSLNQKVVNIHFTMVSTEYHLCNINDIHHRSPQQSLLTGIEVMGDSFKGSGYYLHTSLMSKKLTGKKNFYDNDNNDVYNQNSLKSSNFGANPGQKTPLRGQVKTSWSFQYATYPYIFAKDEATVFLGKCYLLGEELTPLLINMQGVVEQTEFFQRDNYMMLTSIRRSLVDHIEDLHKANPSIKMALSRSQNLDGYKTYEGGKNIVSILEGALLSLGRCVDMVKPAGLHVGSVSKSDWKRALASLEHSMREIHDHCDPDRPLRPSEWGKLVDEEQCKLEL